MSSPVLAYANFLLPFILEMVPVVGENPLSGARGKSQANRVHQPQSAPG